MEPTPFNLVDVREDIIAKIIVVEGGYSNDANDRGGETMYGITIAEARANGYTGPMKDMPRSIAEKIYRDRYWNRLRLDDIGKYSVRIAAELADTGVNMGVGIAAQFFQTALNAFNRQERDYPNIVVDGGIGQRTVQAFLSYIMKRKQHNWETVMLRALNAQQGARYLAITKSDEKQEDFVFGWFDNRVE